MLPEKMKHKSRNKESIYQWIECARNGIIYLDMKRIKTEDNIFQTKSIYLLILSLI